MLNKIKTRLLAVLMGTTMAVAPISMGTCEMMYTPPDDSTITNVDTLPVDDGTSTTDGWGNSGSSTDDGWSGGYGGYSGAYSDGYGSGAFSGGWFTGGGYSTRP
jgi:hypothetical protein